MPKLSPTLRDAYKQTADNLSGSERRVFMAQIVTMLGEGGQRYAERELGWNRGTIRKGMQELDSGERIIDRFHERGRKPIEDKLPNLISDMRKLMSESVLSAKQLSAALISQHGYTAAEVPSTETIRKKMRQIEREK